MTTDTLLYAALGLLAAGSFLAIVFGIAGPRRRVSRPQRETTLAGIQVRLDRARLGVAAPVYVTRSLAVGAALGLLMALATGAWLVVFAGIAAGFAFTWSRLETRRNERLNSYHKALASAAQAIVNSWRVRPSMNRALEAVASYGQREVADDFEEVRRAVRGGSSLAEGLQHVADRRQSPVFDALATALIVAAEASGEVSEMLARQAASTRAAAVIYEETIDEQRAHRTDVLWGIIGPWATLLLLRLFGSAGGGYGAEFFGTVLGQLAAVAAAALTVVAYVHSQRTASRGLIVSRVELERGKGEEAPAPAGQAVG
jgi:hypothetical protein